MQITFIAVHTGVCLAGLWKGAAGAGPLVHAETVGWRPRHPMFLAVLVGLVVFLAILQQLAKVSKPIAVVWDAWNRLLHVIGNFQARVLLTILYAIIVLPFGLIVRLFTDPLRIKHPPTSWIDHPDETMDMNWAKRQ
jgi:hypothetical protein